MGTTKIQKRGPDTNQITGQMNFADLFNTGFGLTTDEKIIKYLFDTREFCDYCGWFNDLKNAYLSGKDLVEESQKMFATCSWASVYVSAASSAAWWPARVADSGPDTR